MRKVVHPTLFSKLFNVSENALGAAELLDPILNWDSKLFIDPLLLTSSSNALIRENAHSLLRAHLQNVVRLLTASREQGDAAWRGASRLLNL